MPFFQLYCYYLSKLVVVNGLFVVVIGHHIYQPIPVFEVVEELTKALALGVQQEVYILQRFVSRVTSNLLMDHTDSIKYISTINAENANSQRVQVQLLAAMPYSCQVSALVSRPKEQPCFEPAIREYTITKPIVSLLEVECTAEHLTYLVCVLRFNNVHLSIFHIAFAENGICTNMHTHLCLCEELIPHLFGAADGNLLFCLFLRFETLGFLDLCEGEWPNWTGVLGVEGLFSPDLGDVPVGDGEVLAEIAQHFYLVVVCLSPFAYGFIGIVEW